MLPKPNREWVRQPCRVCFISHISSACTVIGSCCSRVAGSAAARRRESPRRHHQVSVGVIEGQHDDPGTGIGPAVSAPAGQFRDRDRPVAVIFR